MPSKHFDEAKRHLEELAHVVEHHGLPSHEATYHYHEVREHYGKSPISEQPLFLALLEKADALWAQLQASEQKRIDGEATTPNQIIRPLADPVVNGCRSRFKAGDESPKAERSQQQH